MASETAAEYLTRFLVQAPPSYSGTSKSPMLSYVETEIQAMARKLAQEVVAETEGLADMVRSRARDVVREAMRKDSYLSSTITSAIAKVLTEEALRRADDGD